MRTFVLVSLAALFPAVVGAQNAAAHSEQSAWKQLTIQELLDIDVTTAARKADPIRTTAAPAQVLTREDLHRAGIRYLSEAFRLADGLYVGRFDGRTWVVNARGLSINGANKMQVMIDGRTIYSPLFSGVFWDAQDLLIDDIDRIEIIRGPGASLWGANAVHGVINVITRRAADTQGVLVAVGGGNEERAFVDARYGGRAGRGAYRLYTKYGYRDAQSLSNGDSAHDPMRRVQAGGRYDRSLTASADLTLQGDIYAGRLGLLGSPDTDISGGNALARLTRRAGSGATQVTTFYDRVERHVPNQFGERRDTFDTDAQHTRLFGARHSVVVGGGYRASADETDVTPIASFEPQGRTTHLFNVFAQDEIALGPEVFATLGSRLEHNTYSGWELQPSARIRWTSGRHTTWGAVSRAVRMPTRFDTDIRVTAGLPFVVISGNPEFRPEAMVSYEGGIRTQPLSRVSFEAAVFHSRYDDLRSQDARPGQAVLLGNTIEGHTNGIELGANWEPSTAARVHGSYTWLHKAIGPEPGSLDITGGEGNDPSHMATLQLFADVRRGLRFNVISRYVGALTRPALAAYGEVDVTLQWDVREGVELSFTGQNLLHDRHPEFTSGQPNLEEYDRSLFATLTVRLGRTVRTRP